MPRVVGSSGPAVLLLPGGAEAVEGFFAGLAEGLAEDPGCRVVLHDRPGTGASTVPGGLADAADDLHAAVAGLGPVVVVGQSLGGAVALLLARAHPADVAGLVLLDPTPIHDRAVTARTARSARVIGRLAAFPPARALLRAMLRRGGRRSAERHRMRPDVRAALERTVEVDLAGLARAVEGLEAAADRVDLAALPRVPAVVVTADRRATDPVRLAHERLATALGADLVSWPGAEHAVHLTHPDEVLAVCRDVTRRVAATP